MDIITMFPIKISRLLLLLIYTELVFSVDMPYQSDIDCYKKTTLSDCVDYCMCGWCDNHCIMNDEAHPYGSESGNNSSGWGTRMYSWTSEEVSGKTGDICKVYIPGNCGEGPTIDAWLSILCFIGIGITATALFIIFKCIKNNYRGMLKAIRSQLTRHDSSNVCGYDGHELL